MALFAAKLRDVEHQLLQATQIVQLHVTLTESSFKHHHDDALANSEISSLVDSVERALHNLQTTTRQFVNIFHEHLESRSVDTDDETETEDEAEDVDNEFIGDGGSKPAVEAAGIALKTTICDLSQDTNVLLIEQAQSSEEKDDVEKVDILDTHEDAAAHAGTSAYSEPQCSQISRNNKGSLTVYLEAGKALKTVIDRIPDSESGGNTFERLDAPTIRTWAHAVQINFKMANSRFLKRLISGSIHRNVARSFMEASKLAVALFTSGMRVKFNRCSIVDAIVAYDSIYTTAAGSVVAQELQPILDCRNTLVAYTDDRFSTFLEATAVSTTKMASKAMKARQLKKKLVVTAEKLVSAYRYIMIRREVDHIDPWGEEQWTSLDILGQNLAKMTSHLKTQKLPGWVKDLSTVLDAFEKVYPTRTPKALAELCKGTNTNRKLVENEDQSQILTPSSQDDNELLSPEVGSISGETRGLKRARTDEPDESLSSKRPANVTTQCGRSVDIDASMWTEVKSCFDEIQQLSASLEPGKKVHPSSKAAKDIRGMLHKVIELSKNFSNCITQDDDCVAAYTEAVEILVELIWRCPCGYLSRITLKSLLNQLSGVVESDSGFRSSYERLQTYWDDYYADPFRTMRFHVQTTEKENPTLDSKQLETPLLLLLGQFHETCALCLPELKLDTPSYRIQEMRSSILEIAGMLNIWLNQILESGHQMPKIQNLQNVLAMLARIESRIPESIPPALMKNVKKMMQ
ncbi:hypothetical protein GN244_ATG00659 [Phytophthora infestans]|uniref:Uncharacterized protein n=1 Tax=Phytophthora infestans TaxID=4787 RepID=A0A833SE53_PHYIN|nr:hypothetical protein GN244_ATG00659 [Phytophthora infestans]KAF4127546.1 hypothetical protein GN958_ATG23275 [Phytophthora infestans]